jgi:ribosomal protein L7/L12
MELQRILDDVKMLDTVGNSYRDNIVILKSFKKVQTELLRLAQRQINPKPVKQPKPFKEPKLYDGLTKEEAELARGKDGKIPAIKAVRQRLMDAGLPYDLKVAKDIVENYLYKNPTAAPAGWDYFDTSTDE